MAERRGGVPAPECDTSIVGEDWYGRDLSGQTFERTLFVDVDMTEATSAGAVFRECSFRGVKFKASRHEESAFLNCTFTACNFFDTRFVGAKLIGSMFDRCEFALLQVEGGDWSFVGFPGATREEASFIGVRMREADLTFARCAKATLSHCDLSASWFHGADLSETTLTGSDLAGLDPVETVLKGAYIDEHQAVQLAEAMGLRVIA